MPLLRFAVRNRRGDEILLARPMPGSQDPWGEMAPLRQTPWGKYITEVTGEVMSLAVHGYLEPLRQTGIHNPQACIRGLNPEAQRCSLRLECAAHDLNSCLPGKKTPDCYLPPLDPDAALIAREVTLCWKEGRVVVVVVGEEFVAALT